MPITMHAGGGISVTGDESMKLYRMLTIKSGLRLEMKGLRLTRGRSCYAIAKSEYGLRGNKQRVYEQFCKLCDEQSAKVPRVEERPEESAAGPADEQS